MIEWSVLLGGITGLFGNMITGWFKYKDRKLKNEHEQKMVELNTAAMITEAKMQIQITKAKIEGEVELAETGAYTESIKSGNKPMFSEKWIDKLFSVEGKVLRWFTVPTAIVLSFGFGMIDFLRGFMRPALTLYLTGMSTVITWMAWDILQKAGVEAMTAVQALDIYSQTTTIVIYLTVSTVTWWFGDRTMAKHITQMDKK